MCCCPQSDLNASEIIASTTLLDQIADQDDVWIRNVRRYGYFQVDRVERAAGRARPAAGGAVCAHRRRQRAGCAGEGHHVGTAFRDRASRIDEMGLLPGHWERLADALPNATLVPAFQLLRRVRAVKTQEEIARLGRVARITEDSIDAALNIASEGVTESELARPFHSCTVMNDAFPVIGCIGFGTRAAMPNVQPSATPLKRGDVIRFDVGGRYKHYRADIARIAVLGEADRKTSEYCHALHVGVLKALEMIRPGVRASDVFATAVEAVRREGISHYNRSHVGHGIGLDGYDLPDLTAASQDIIEEGMVMCVETPYYELGWTGLQVEDMVVVRRDGVENLMSSERRLEDRAMTVTLDTAARIAARGSGASNRRRRTRRGPRRALEPGDARPRPRLSAGQSRHRARTLRFRFPALLPAQSKALPGHRRHGPRQSRAVASQRRAATSEPICRATASIATASWSRRSPTSRSTGTPTPSPSCSAAAIRWMRCCSTPASRNATSKARTAASPSTSRISNAGRPGSSMGRSS